MTDMDKESGSVFAIPPMHESLGFSSQLEMNRSATAHVRAHMGNMNGPMSPAMSPATMVATMVGLATAMNAVPEIAAAVDVPSILIALWNGAVRRGDSVITAALTNAQVQHSQAWLVCWLRSGFPDLHLGHRLAASLMATSVSADVMASLRFPWRAFLIRVPPGLLHFANPDGSQAEVSSIAVLEHDGEQSDGRVGFEMWSGGVTCGRFRVQRDELVDFDEANSDTASHLDLEDVDLRAITLAGRLVVGAILELGGTAERTHDPERVRGSARPKPNRRGEPRLWRFQLVRDVVVDVRPAVLAYNRHGGTSPTVQSLVRGHYKRQAHGPLSALRKWIQVEPYWRGPEEAPIATRAHSLKDGTR